MDCCTTKMQAQNYGKSDDSMKNNIGKSDNIRIFAVGKPDNIMLKRKIDSYLDNFFTRSKKALLLTGARQTGKSFSIRQ